MMLPPGPTLFVYEIISGILWILICALIVNAVASWLVTFNVINPRNRAVNMILRGLDAVTAPLLWPLRKVIPPLGGIDVTPVIAWLIIQAFQSALLPRIMEWLYGLIG
ncbi:MAG TPA: YggT family protein [Caulobacteraceae bacterium]|jgi:YggT family protein|nr:YggT family protein [Caulobacteraceae bacterium]